MAPSPFDALVITVDYPRTPRAVSSRTLRVPLASLGPFMAGLHLQGAVITHVGCSDAQSGLADQPTDPDPEADEAELQDTSTSIDPPSQALPKRGARGRRKRSSQS